MGRNNEQAEPMKRLKAETRRGSVYGPRRALPQRRLRIGSMLCCALIALLSLALPIPGQQPVLRPGSIDVANPLKELQYRFPGNGPQAETDLEFKGNGRDWSFIMFDELPQNVTLKVKGNPAGYTEDELLQIAKYYPFKMRLPLVMEIKPEAQMPVVIKYRFGSADTQEDQDLLKKSDLKAEDVRKLASSTLKLKTDAEPLKLIFSWGAAATTPTPIPPPESTWLTYLTEEEPVVGILALLIILCVLALLGILFLPDLIWRIRHVSWRWPWRSFKRKKRSATERANTTRAKATSEADPLGGLGMDTTMPTDQEESALAQEGNEATSTALAGYDFNREDDSTLSGQKQRTQEGHPRRLMPGERVEPPPKPAATQPAALGSLDGKKLVELETKLGQLENMLGQKVDRRDNLTDAARANVDDMLVQWESSILRRVEENLRQIINAEVKPIEDLMTEQASSMKTKMDETAAQIKQVAGDGEKVRQKWEEVQMELGKVEERLQVSLTKLRTELQQQIAPDAIYAKALGDAFGQTVDTLQNGNFEQQIVERLNKFFQTGIEQRGEGLQDLRARAEGISAALKDVSSQMEKLNPHATNEARQPIQRVETVVSDLLGLQAQLQSRRAIIETKLRIPVSMHAGARQTFLDELGRGIRREIDKFTEPESYFEGELERSITADLIAIVDICDKKVASSPGTRPELEAALKRLFEEAGLRQILPQPREPFKTSEQDLVEMVQGRGEPSLTVAQVMTRGFYYKHRDNETLLRKAGVSVYR